jgi:hypothetical protein
MVKVSIAYHNSRFGPISVLIVFAVENAFVFVDLADQSLLT